MDTPEMPEAWDEFILDGHLVLVYDAFDGYACPEGKVDSYVDWILSLRSDNYGSLEVFSTESLLHAIRVRIKRGLIDHTKVKLFVFRLISGEYTNIELLIDRDGNIEHWPKGFCDYNETAMIEMLGWDKEK